MITSDNINHFINKYASDVRAIQADKLLWSSQRLASFPKTHAKWFQCRAKAKQVKEKAIKLVQEIHNEKKF